MDSLVYRPAYQLAERVRSRTVSVQQLVAAHLDHIHQQNPLLNAICTLDAETAQRQAQQADSDLAQGKMVGPLHGVPITIKDLFKTKGLKTTAGFRELAGYVPEDDAPMVARLKQAGAIILGKTNTPKAGGDYQSVNAVFGRTQNPWGLGRTSGGSSGGSAAAVAAGFSSLDLCSDFGGSIRQPVHFCGLYGLKPTDRRVATVGHIPPLPDLPESIRYMLTVGLLARSLPDLKLGLQVIAGPLLQQPDIPAMPLTEPQETVSLQGLRLAWCKGIAPLWPQQSICSTITQAVESLEIGGAQMIPWQTAGWDWEKLLSVYYRLSTLSLRYVQRPTVNALTDLAQQFWREWSQSDADLRPLMAVKHTLPTLLNPSLKGYFEALTERDRIAAWFDDEFVIYDALLLPVAMTTAIAHCPTGSAIDIDGRAVPYWLANGAYLQPFNLLGHPAVVIPIGQDETGLPIGLQIVGHRWQEMKLLAIAQTIDNKIGQYSIPPSVQQLAG